MPDEEHPLAPAACVLGDQVPGAAGGSGERGETIGEAKGGELRAVEIGEFANSGEILGGAVELHVLLQIAGKGADLRVDGGHDLLLVGREGGVSRGGGRQEK